MQNSLNISGQLRLKILEMYYRANAGHIGCSLSCIDLMIVALVQHKRLQDDFLLSKGHAAAALYACLNYIGEISDETLATFYQDATTLPAHPAPNKHKSIPFATGSLGHGLPIGTGIAKANQIAGNDGRVFVLMSDGETNEGTTWEAAHFAVQHQLQNLILLVDKNGLQGFGETKNVFGDSISRATFEAIGFEVIVLDGHDIEAITYAINHFTEPTKPKLIIAHTTKGKGVSYMENRLEWHYLPMNQDQYEIAKTDVRLAYNL